MRQKRGRADVGVSQWIPHWQRGLGDTKARWSSHLDHLDRGAVRLGDKEDDTRYDSNVSITGKVWESGF